MASSCGSREKESSNNIVMHPIEERIPYYGRDHISIDTTRTFEELQEKPEALVLFHQYLQNPDQFTIEKLDVNIGSPHSGFNVVSVGNGRLIVLDADNNHLFEYNLNNHSKSTLAELGRGPGDIMFSEEMVKHNDFIYIVSGNMRISRFDCRPIPCEFNKTIPLGFSPTSLALFDDSLAALGFIDVSSASGQKFESELEDLKAVHVLDDEGNEIDIFGDTYNTGGHWMLLRPFVSDGMVRYSSTEDLFILAFASFPFLYIYNAHNRELKETYKISNFLLGNQKYWPNIGRLQTIMKDHSAIRSLKVIEGSLLWIKAEMRKNYRNKRPLWDRQLDYYIVNLEDQQTYYMGDIKVEEDDVPFQTFYFIQDGLIIYKKGSLFWLKM